MKYSIEEIREVLQSYDEVCAESLDLLEVFEWVEIIRGLLAEVGRLKEEEERLEEGGKELLRLNKLWEEKCYAAQTLAATHLAGQELLVGMERRKVAQECAKICDNIANGYGGHASWAADTIRDRYGVGNE